MGGLRWKSNVLRTVFFIPGCAFSVFFFLNILLWSSGSSAAIPFTTFIKLLALFFGISTPLTVLGSYLGFRKIVSASLMLYMYTVNIPCVCVCVCTTCNIIAGDWATNGNQSDSSWDPWSELAVSSSALLSGGHPPLWLHCHSTLLHPQQYLVSLPVCSSLFFTEMNNYAMYTALMFIFPFAQVWVDVLHVWVHHVGLHHPHRGVCSDLHPPLLFPPLLRGLSLVVAFLLLHRDHFSLRTLVCCVLLYVRDHYHWDLVLHTLLWLHTPHCVLFLHYNRWEWVGIVLLMMTAVVQSVITQHSIQTLSEYFFMHVYSTVPIILLSIYKILSVILMSHVIMCFPVQELLGSYLACCLFERYTPN